MSHVGAPPLYLLETDLPWWTAAWGVSAGARGTAKGVSIDQHRADLLRTWVEGGFSDPASAVADALLFGPSTAWRRAERADGVKRALVADVERIVRVLDALGSGPGATDGPPDASAVPLRDLAPEPPGGTAVATLRHRMLEGVTPNEIVEHVLAWRREHGGGPLGRYRALKWQSGALVGVARPAGPRLERMAELDRQIDALTLNTEAFLAGKPAMHALLYGPRGSGKSTVVRALLTRYAERGLRLIELPADALVDLPDVLAQVRDRPERFLIFVDDLSFESGDARYHPLKSLLEGSVEARPDHVRLYATSNRRHLVQERLRDRPDPLDDDVHAWDTQNERLALADRFGLLVTFPSADRSRYLEIVRHIAQRDGLADDEARDLEGRADRFARSGNGYSGRTAQQFVDAARAGLA